MGYKVLFDAKESGVIQVVGKGLFVPVEKFIELEQKNINLMAAVNSLRIALDDCIENMELNGQHDDGEYKRAVKVRASTPQQCLREIQAEAGWIGFVKGYESFKTDDSPNDKLILADKYYEDIIKGEVG